MSKEDTLFKSHICNALNNHAGYIWDTKFMIAYWSNHRIVIRVNAYTFMWFKETSLERVNLYLPINLFNRSLDVLYVQDMNL